MMTMSAAVLAMAVVVCGGFRARQRQRGAMGKVDGLYTFGAPGTTVGGIVNPQRKDGCFPGKRFWNSKDPKYFGGGYIDTVTKIARVAGFIHAKMDGVNLNTSSGKSETFECTVGRNDLMDEPSGSGDMSLHEPWLYIEEAEKYSPLMFNITNIGLRKSYFQDPEEVAKKVAEYGWNLVSTAVDEGDGSIIGGYQVSHLIQNPESLSCMITFQGSASIGDWFGNVMIARREFCGFPTKVHTGFRDHLRRIIQSSGFQNEIRPNLSMCSEVLVTGHSLGGAMAELFTACAAHAPGFGEPGHEDYKYVGWHGGKARKLPAQFKNI